VMWKPFFSSMHSLLNGSSSGLVNAGHDLNLQKSGKFCSILAFLKSPLVMR